MPGKLMKDIKKYKYVYLMLIPVLAYYIIFCYVPMGGLIMAFKDYAPRKGIFGSDWVGLKYFLDFFKDMYFVRLMRNTFMLNVYDIIIGFPAPIILALLLNEITGKKFKNTVQTMLYMPNFVSLVVLCGIVVDFCATEGVINDILAFIGFEPNNLLQNPWLLSLIHI